MRHHYLRNAAYGTCRNGAGASVVNDGRHVGEEFQVWVFADEKYIAVRGSLQRRLPEFCNDNPSSGRPCRLNNQRDIVVLILLGMLPNPA